MPVCVMLCADVCNACTKAKQTVTTMWQKLENKKVCKVKKKLLWCVVLCIQGFRDLRLRRSGGPTESSKCCTTRWHSIISHLGKSRVDGKIIDIELDTRAAVSIISEELYNAQFKSSRLRVTNN